MTTDPTTRADFIAGLRRLAAFLADNPKVPVPTYGTEISVHADGTDTQQRAAVDRIADLIGAPASDGGHYVTARDFGPVTYRAVAVSEERMDDWHALMSYSDNVSV
ncbi:hypothetical protein N5079_04940 [Planotetraspora sp. A-T 1434]|uniref:hypothetical protein n=1 Tax=Planotetraspora sp. A-T 1434 TaxID=2979219 RepID=UPI0021BEC2F6|nr:hypothetical protein [Planotetraspora sp. A-T 1434]MCT9929563.1 hypothetical protein [Planotetraspora sp. A-T 1434]